MFTSYIFPIKKRLIYHFILNTVQLDQFNVRHHLIRPTFIIIRLLFLLLQDLRALFFVIFLYILKGHKMKILTKK